MRLPPKYVPLGPLLTHLHKAATDQGLKGHKDRAHTVPFVVIVLSLGFAWRHRNGNQNVINQLTGALINADAWPLGIIWQCVKVQNVFHTPQKACGQLADAPLAFEVGLEFVFLSTSCTVTWEMLSTTSNSTSLFASKRSDQRACLSGGSEHARAVICALCWPVKVLDLPGRGFSLTADSKPSLTKRCI